MYADTELKACSDADIKGFAWKIMGSGLCTVLWSLHALVLVNSPASALSVISNSNNQYEPEFNNDKVITDLHKYSQREKNPPKFLVT